MKLLIKIIQGESCVVEISEESTILDIKKQIQSKIRIPVQQQVLVSLGKTLVDEKPVSFYPSLTDNAKVNLVVKKPEALNVVMVKFLQKYYNEAQAKKICDEFMKDFNQKIETLSLDDLERLATYYLNEENI